jgi:ABC-type antimicrobial peptide transport system permease subunit
VACGPDVPAAECPPSEEPFIVAGVLSSSESLFSGAAFVLAPVLSDNIAALAPEVMAPLTDDERRSIMPVLERVRGEVSAEDEVLAWTEISPEMEDMLRMMDVGPLIFLIIFYIAVMLGIVNTMLMATFERTRELGLMKALGMRPRRVVALVMTESAMLAAVGVLIGLLIGSGIFAYWSFHGMDLGVFMGERQSFDMSGVTFDPVLWPRVTAFDVLASSLTVATMTTLAGLWPAIRASRLHPTEALRYE